MLKSKPDPAERHIVELNKWAWWETTTNGDRHVVPLRDAARIIRRVIRAEKVSKSK